MPTTTKLYHRGNNDAGEPNTLTAVMQVSLTADNSDCTYGPILVAMPDFGTGTWHPDPESVAEFPAKKAECGGELSKAVTDPKLIALDAIRDDDWLESLCLGDVKVTLNVAFASPNGRGNGEAQAGGFAARFGIEHNGAFHRFNGGPLAPGSEHWRVTQEVQIGTVPCKGGTLMGTAKVNMGAGRAAAYTIEYKVVVASCGDISEQKVALLQGVHPRALGMGGRTADVLREVNPFDRLPYPVSNPVPGADYRVGPTGQPGILL